MPFDVRLQKRNHGPIQTGLTLHMDPETFAFPSFADTPVILFLCGSAMLPPFSSEEIKKKKKSVLFFWPTLQLSGNISPIWIDTSVILQAVATSCIGKKFFFAMLLLPIYSARIPFVNHKEVNSLEEPLNNVLTYLTSSPCCIHTVWCNQAGS